MAEGDFRSQCLIIRVSRTHLIVTWRELLKVEPRGTTSGLRKRLGIAKLMDRLAQLVRESCVNPPAISSFWIISDPHPANATLPNVMKRRYS